jgi:hypothetical protein
MAGRMRVMIISAGTGKEGKGVSHGNLFFHSTPQP